jgi:GNAT superfamily N-acetyltransferase
MTIEYRKVAALDPAIFIDILERSGLAERRPVGDPERIGRMLRNADLVIVAFDGETAVGVARSITDYTYCCYLSDLAVDRAYQGCGIGKRLIEETRAAAGPEAMCLLLSAPGAMTFYQSIGMPAVDNAFMYQRER